MCKTSETDSQSYCTNLTKSRGGCWVKKMFPGQWSVVHQRPNTERSEKFILADNFDLSSRELSETLKYIQLSSLLLQVLHLFSAQSVWCQSVRFDRTGASPTTTPETPSCRIQHGPIMKEEQTHIGWFPSWLWEAAAGQRVRFPLRRPLLHKLIHSRTRTPAGTTPLQLIVRSLLPANQVGFGLFCQLPHASFWRGSKGDGGVLKQQLPLLLLRVLLHVPGRASPLVTGAHWPSRPLSFVFCVRFPPTGPLWCALRRGCELFCGVSAAPPQRLGGLCERGCVLSSYYLGPPASPRRCHTRVWQHRGFLCRGCPALITCGLTQVLVQLLPALLLLLLGSRPASWPWRTPWTLFWRTQWRLHPRSAAPPPHSQSHMTVVAIYVRRVMRWSGRGF